MKQLNKNTSGSAAKSKKQYYLADYLCFLDTYIKSRQPTGNLQPLSPEIADEHSNSTQDLSDVDESRDTNEFSRQAISITTDTSAPSTPEPSTSASVQSGYKRQRKRSATINEVNTAAIDYFEFRKKQHNSASSATDPDEAFLKSVLPDMKNMTETQKRNFKVGVLHLAGQILNQPVVTPSSLAYNDAPSSSSLITPIQNKPAQRQEQNVYTLLLPQFSPVSQTTNSPAPNSNQDSNPSSYYNDNFSQY